MTMTTLATLSLVTSQHPSPFGQWVILYCQHAVLVAKCFVPILFAKKMNGGGSLESQKMESTYCVAHARWQKIASFSPENIVLHAFGVENCDKYRTWHSRGTTSGMKDETLTGLQPAQPEVVQQSCNANRNGKHAPATLGWVAHGPGRQLASLRPRNLVAVAQMALCAARPARQLLRMKHSPV